MNQLSLRLTWVLSALLATAPAVWAQTIHVSPQGKDTWPGTAKKPVATLGRAQQLARQYGPDENVTVWMEDGTYYLPTPLRLTAEDSKRLPATVTFRARHTGKAIVSGGEELHLKWERQPDGIWTAAVTGQGDIDQLYINGIRQRMARFPNAEPGEGKNVFDTWTLQTSAPTDPDRNPLAPERTARWKHPEGGYLHAMHNYLWGDMHWRITGKKADGTLEREGGWQNNRPSEMHPVYRMVENIREELDAPGEWYHDANEHRLYYLPTPGTDLQHAKVEVVRLTHLMELDGSRERPVSGIRLKGLVFRHTRRTFMLNKEPLLRSDWTIYRGGAVVFNGASDCEIIDCEFDQTGGNAIFVNNYNRRLSFTGCHIHDSGANGISFVGDPATVRSPLFRYGPQDYARIDRKTGPQGDNFPQECTVEDCLITRTGRDEKQTAPIQISMAYRIRVSHCSIYDVPRAGINISEGTFGGHVIEHCDVFNTVLETGDHGSFNSWGRDRYWTPDVARVSDMVANTPDMSWWDMLEPNIIRDSRWRCDHGWDIDLDDGSSHYRIYNNLLLCGGLKLREGYDRIVTNNIIVNNTLHPHVWFRHSEDVFKHNIVFGAYRPAVMQSAIAADGKWGKELDYNLFAASKDEKDRFSVNQADLHSLTGDPQFIDAEAGDFRVADTSPAWLTGFQNFPTLDYGVRRPRLRAIAKTPALPAVRMNLHAPATTATNQRWMGAVLKEVRGSELSAFGVGFDKAGIAVESVADTSEAARTGLRAGDLIQAVNGERTVDFNTFSRWLQNSAAVREITLIREQQPLILQREP
ncbi:MAG: PDZ domain-containing protein [Bacteroidales bacterium]|nr:PDZ domain-containing protein [Bacteroidales bacterium]